MVAVTNRSGKGNGNREYIFFWAMMQYEYALFIFGGPKRSSAASTALSNTLWKNLWTKASINKRSECTSGYNIYASKPTHVSIHMLLLAYVASLI